MLLSCSTFAPEVAKMQRAGLTDLCGAQFSAFAKMDTSPHCYGLQLKQSPLPVKRGEGKALQIDGYFA